MLSKLLFIVKSIPSHLLGLPPVIQLNRLRYTALSALTSFSLFQNLHTFFNPPIRHPLRQLPAKRWLNKIPVIGKLIPGKAAALTEFVSFVFGVVACVQQGNALFRPNAMNEIPVNAVLEQIGYMPDVLRYGALAVVACFMIVTGKWIFPSQPKIDPMHQKQILTQLLILQTQSAKFNAFINIAGPIFAAVIAVLIGMYIYKITKPPIIDIEILAVDQIIETKTTDPTLATLLIMLEETKTSARNIELLLEKEKKKSLSGSTANMSASNALIIETKDEGRKN